MSVLQPTLPGLTRKRFTAARSTSSFDSSPAARLQLAHHVIAKILGTRWVAVEPVPEPGSPRWAPRAAAASVDGEIVQPHVTSWHESVFLVVLWPDSAHPWREAEYLSASPDGRRLLTLDFNGRPITYREQEIDLGQPGRHGFPNVAALAALLRG